MRDLQSITDANNARAAQLAAQATAGGRLITRIYVTRYRDNGMTCAYVCWYDGSRTEATLRTYDIGHGRRARTFGTHMHALFRRAKAQGLRVEWETW